MANSSNNIPTKSMRVRAKTVMTLVFAALFGVVVFNFFNISIKNNDQYQAMANDQHFGSISIPAHRGSIFDSTGTALAKSATVYRIFLDPIRFREELEDLQKDIDKQLEEKKNGTYVPEIDKETGEQLDILPISADAFRQDAVNLFVSKLGITAEKVNNSMDADNQYSILQEQVEKPVADELLQFFSQYKLTSLHVEEDTKRYYPQNELAASVIGFTSGDGSGIYGIEAYYDDYLSGIDGKTISAKDSHGNELPYKYAKTYPAKNGNDLYLTIDYNIQYYLEKHLEEMVTKFEVKNRGCAIIMNPKTGAIYGMATYPSFDLNNPMKITYNEPTAESVLQEKDNENLAEAQLEEALDEAKAAAREAQWKNKCITEIYEPGSVFKVFTSSAAIEENLIDLENDTFFCSGVVELPGALKPIKCHLTSGHGSQSFYLALTNSCNPAFMEIGARLGVQKFMYYYDAFGLSGRTGVDLPGEGVGVCFDKEEMSNVDLAVSAFGQGNTVTPMQMITGYAAVINGGYLVEPHVVDKIVDEDGNVVLKNERTVKRQVISEETSAKMRDALEQVVTSNGGGNVTIKGYSIGGKSGTSQRLSLTSEEDEDQEYAASYVCFTPADDPELILLVMADMPNKNIDYYGSKVAVPTAREILTDVLPYLGFNPEYNDEELANLDVKVPLLEGPLDDAIKTLEGLGLEYEKIGEGSSVLSQSPVTGSSVAKGGKVYLYTTAGSATEYTEVPDFKGLTAGAVRDSIAYCNLNYVSVGASIDRADAVVATQSIEPKRKVPKGTTITLEFIVNADQD